MLAAVGDMTGDGYPDLMGQPAGSAACASTRATAAPACGASYAAYGRITGTQVVGIGRWDGDGAPDVMIRNGNALDGLDRQRPRRTERCDGRLARRDGLRLDRRRR